MIYRARRKGENFNDYQNRVDVTVSGSWTRFSDVTDDNRVIDFQAVYWSCSDTVKFLVLRDAYNDVIYYKEPLLRSLNILSLQSGSMVGPDVLSSPVTVRLPIYYLTNHESCSIRVWGKYT